MGFQALKIPGEGHSATIKLKAYCKMTEACLIKATKIMNNYTEYISSHLN